VTEHLEEPREYIGSSLWNRLAYVPGQPVLHVHACPVCYRYLPCQGACTLEPDLEMTDGTPSGSHMCCSQSCAESNDEIIREVFGEDWRPTDYWKPPKEQLALPGLLPEEGS